MGSYLRKDIGRLFLGLLLVLYLSVFSLPSVAQSSLQSIASCAKSPSCASQLGIQQAIRNGTAANNVVPFTLKTRSGAGLVERAVNTLGIVGLAKLIGIDGDSYSYGGIKESGINKITEAAQAAYAEASSAGNIGTPNVLYKVYWKRPTSNWTFHQNGYGAVGNIRFEGNQLRYDQGIGSPNFGSRFIYNPANDAVIGVFNFGDDPNGGSASPIEPDPVDPEVAWSTATDAEKDAAINEVLPNVNLNSNDVQEESVPLPNDWEQIIIEPLNDLVTNQPDNPIVAAGESITIDRDTDGDGILDPDDPDDDNDGIPDTEDTDSDGDGTEDIAEIQQTNLESPTLTEISPQGFSQLAWPNYAQAQLANKFPFDFFGSFTAAGDVNECPTYTFFEEDFELCPVRDVIVIAKYPVIIAFAIWAVMVL